MDGPSWFDQKVYINALFVVYLVLVGYCVCKVIEDGITRWVIDIVADVQALSQSGV